ncbi:histidine triad family protein isoform X1 [Solanum lycopersicum]|uniref:histidine triad family protein isoform X1 n=1 Tax=Solanum lycopersicum TaxID=4081 RepID=UPI000E1D9245|nr:histidine triad family protein isoform X1 [Solanum lycopersicum]
MEATSTATALRRLSLISSHFRTHCSSLQVSPFSCSSTDGENHENGCVFCMIVRGKAPALKVYEDDVCLCILDANPLCFGHSLVIPKSHFTSLQETPSSVVAAMSSKLPLISSAVMKATGCDSFNLLVNNGAAAGQVIYHTLSRCPLKSDEAQKLADGIRENLSISSNIEDSKGQGSSLVVN